MRHIPFYLCCLSSLLCDNSPPKNSITHTHSIPWHLSTLAICIVINYIFSYASIYAPRFTSNQTITETATASRLHIYEHQVNISQHKAVKRVELIQYRNHIASTIANNLLSQSARKKIQLSVFGGNYIHAERIKCHHICVTDIALGENVLLVSHKHTYIYIYMISFAFEITQSIYSQNDRNYYITQSKQVSSPRRRTIYERIANRSFVYVYL